jgi:glycosyltransferase involved in cell wall biosynthesis
MAPIEVSVIIPTFNYGHFIEDSLTSLLNQTFRYWECIIVDNGSTDNSAEIIKQFIARDTRIKYVFIEHTTTSKARNTGIKSALGKYIQFLDSDDMLSPSKLQCHFEELESNPATDLVYSNALYFDDTDVQKQHLRKTRNEGGKDDQIHFSGSSWELMPIMNKRNVWTICSPMFRKSILVQSGMFNNHLNWVEDWEFYFRILAQNIQIKYVENDEVGSLVRVHKRSLSHKNLNMYSQSIMARKFVKETINRAAEKGYIKADDLLSNNSKQIIFLYKLKFNHLISEKQNTKALINGIIISKKLSDYRLFFKIILSFLMMRLRPIEV